MLHYKVDLFAISSASARTNVPQTLSWSGGNAMLGVTSCGLITATQYSVAVHAATAFGYNSAVDFNADLNDLYIFKSWRKSDTEAMDVAW